MATVPFFHPKPCLHYRVGRLTLSREMQKKVIFYYLLKLWTTLHVSYMTSEMVNSMRGVWCFAIWRCEKNMMLFLIRTFCVSFQISLVCLLYPVSLKACQNWSTKYVQMTPPVSWKPQSSSGNFFQMVLDMFNARCNSFLFVIYIWS